MNPLVVTISRKVINLAAHIMMVVAAFFSAIIICFEGVVPADIARVLLGLLPFLIIIKILSFNPRRLYTVWWRYVSISDLLMLVRGNILGSLLFSAFVILSQTTMPFIWSILVLDGLICFFLMCGARVVVRVFCEYYRANSKSCVCDTKRVIVVGAGTIGQSVVREIKENPNLYWKVVGYIDQDKERLKQYFQGVQVLSDLDGLECLLQGTTIDKVILANHAMSGEQIRKVVAACQKHNVVSMILPNVGEILDGKVSVHKIREVKYEDLLGRPQIHLDFENIRNFLCGKKVLVTGAAGSIGREICHQVAGFGVSSLIIFDNAETPLFHIEREINLKHPEINLINCLNDVRNRAQVDYVFSQYMPEVVFHAAAYKHVPMSEMNPLSTIENNVIGTRNLVDAAHRYAVDKFVMVSTDKAVKPSNIMGASKRVAEIYVQVMAYQSKTCFVTVRFGNVLGSNGSVIPIFQEQIRNGGPVTVTDPEATRFFMIIPEAVQLVLQAGSMGKGGEIFILKMGEQINIAHLASELIRLSGKVPNRDIEIVYTGLRPGEKLHEELLLDNEDILPTDHEKICVASSCKHDFDTLITQLDYLEKCCKKIDKNEAIEVIGCIVKEFSYSNGNHDVYSISDRFKIGLAFKPCVGK